MAIALTVSEFTNQGSKYKTYGTGNLGTYVNTGGVHGVAVTARACGLGTIDDLQIHAASGYIFDFDKANLRIKAFRRDSHTHVLHVQTSLTGGALQGTTNNLRATAPAFDIAGVADSTGEGGVVNAAQAALAEVTDAVDLSAITFRWECLGT